MAEPIRVAVTGGAGHICYNLLYRIASGEMFGKDQPVALHILELPIALEKLQGVVMELDDCAFPLLTEVVTGDDPHQVFDGVSYAILVGARPRSQGMERADLLQANAQIFVDQGKALNRPDVKVLVVGNPANTNALVVKHNAPNLPAENIRSMMRLDQNRAIAQLAQKAKVPMSEVKKVAVFGNHSPTMVIAFCSALIGGKSACEVIDDTYWFQKEFMKTVQKRGAAIINARGLSSAASAAHAAIQSIVDWNIQTPEDDWYTAGIYSNGNPYEFADDLYFSFPLRNNQIVADLEVDEFLKERLVKTEEELLNERDAVKDYLA